VVAGARHADLSDIALFKSIVDLGGLFEVGPIDGARAVFVVRRYVTAWLELALSGRPDRVLRGESTEFPEVDFQP
jgi:hypothetical protein